MKKILKVLKIILLIVLLFLAVNTLVHQVLLQIEKLKLEPTGKMIEINGNNIHVYSQGDQDVPTLVFMSGSATVDPVYDFKPLYSQLTDAYRIVVIEKIGYGYSSIADVDRDIDAVLNDTREALSLAGEEGPYILVPHSMSGIEALYWAQQYPDEVHAIIGLDMALPDSYDNFDFVSVNRSFSLGRAAIFMGLHRTFTFAYPHYSDGLTEQEKQQQKYLIYRNALNQVYQNEGNSIQESANILRSNEIADVDMLLFLSNGEGLSEQWIPSAKKFSEENDAQLIYLNCYHYIHHYENQKIADEIISWLNNIK